jgi:DHA3 family macrolide efflux protein-like MFS transporter
MQGVLVVDVATAVLAIAPLFTVHIPQPERGLASEMAARPSLVSDLGAAMHFLRNRTGILLVIGIGVLVNCLIFPALSLQPLLVTEHFGGDALQLAWLQSAFGVGMVAGGITLSVWGGFKRRAVTGLVALGLNGVGLALVGVAPANSFPLAVGAMFFAWFMNPIANGSLFAVLQTIVPAEMQGRVFTLLNSAAGAMIPVGLVIAGPLADLLGVRFWFLAAGVAMGVMAVAALFVPAITRLEDMKSSGIAGAARADDAVAVPASAR